MSGIVAQSFAAGAELQQGTDYHHEDHCHQLMHVLMQAAMTDMQHMHLCM